VAHFYAALWPNFTPPLTPRTADAIATGYIFETTLQNGSWICFNKELAPLAIHIYLFGRGAVQWQAACSQALKATRSLLIVPSHSLKKKLASK